MAQASQPSPVMASRLTAAFFTVTMFDLKTLAPIKQIKVETGGLDGIMYDEPDDKIILTNHSRPIGTVTVIDPKKQVTSLATVELPKTRLPKVRPPTAKDTSSSTTKARARSR